MLSTSFLEFIKSENLFEKDEHLLLAISGGLDSVVLAHLLKQENYSFSLAHMNFQLRGDDSNQDEQFVRKLAERLGIDLFVKKVQIEQDKGSTQLQARELRYDWFRQLSSKYSFSKILTAHHANDLLETALLNFARGTGIKGLRSIVPLQNEIARPLLFAEKSELEQFAKAKSIEWREDISNFSDHYTRNKLRHQIIPQLLDLNPNLIGGFRQTAFRLRATEVAWEEKLKSISHDYIKSAGKHIAIDLSILDMPYALVYLSELLAEYNFSLQQLKSFDFSRVGAQLFSSSHVLTVDRKKILLSKNTEIADFRFFPVRFTFEERIVKTPFGSISFDFVKPEDVRFGGSSKVAFVAFESLIEPFEIDLWQQGDKIQPLGMKGQKKISDILIDEKIPLPEKKQIMLLKSAGEIVWVIGYQLSELVKVKKDTTKILQIVYENS